MILFGKCSKFPPWPQLKIPKPVKKLQMNYYTFWESEPMHTTKHSIVDVNTTWKFLCPNIPKMVNKPWPNYHRRCRKNLIFSPSLQQNKFAPRFLSKWFVVVFISPDDYSRLQTILILCCYICVVSYCVRNHPHYYPALTHIQIYTTIEQLPLQFRLIWHQWNSIAHGRYHVCTFLGAPL